VIDLELARLALRNTHKPHWICKDVAGDIFEFISYPYIERDRVVIKARVPGDPTSIFTADALALDPEGKECMCAAAGKDFYLRADYYREREARLMESPAFLWKGEL
jgi:hypothetical protein